MSVLGGFLSGQDNSAALLQAMVELSKSEKLIRQIPSFLQYIRSSKECLDFTLKLLKENKLTIDDLVILRHGSPLGILEPKEAMPFCEDLANYGINGAKLALEILYMYCFGTSDRFEHCKKLLIALISKENMLSGDVNTLDLYNWSELVKKYIPELPSEFSEHICKELIAFCSSSISDKLGSIDELRDITISLFNNHYKIAWSYFGTALLEKSNWEIKFGVEHLLRVDSGDIKKTDKSPLTHIPYDYLQSWCQQNAPEGPATIMRLLPFIWEENDRNYGIDELSSKLLLDFGNYEEVRHSATSQIYSFTSCGSREPYYLRRIDVLKDFKKSANNKVLKNWIDAIIVSLEKEALESKTEHDEFEAGIFDRK
jgi:hypothetical protein